LTRRTLRTGSRGARRAASACPPRGDRGGDRGLAGLAGMQCGGKRVPGARLFANQRAPWGQAGRRAERAGFEGIAPGPLRGALSRRARAQDQQQEEGAGQGQGALRPHGSGDLRDTERPRGTLNALLAPACRRKQQQRRGGVSSRAERPAPPSGPPRPAAAVVRAQRAKPALKTRAGRSRTTRTRNPRGLSAGPPARAGKAARAAARAAARQTGVPGTTAGRVARCAGWAARARRAATRAWLRRWAGGLTQSGLTLAMWGEATAVHVPRAGPGGCAHVGKCRFTAPWVGASRASPSPRLDK